MTWNPDLYRRFEAERNRPAGDLIHALGNRSPGRIADLGCGPGNSTEALVRRFRKAEVTGIDSDAAMVEAARLRLPEVAFEQADIAHWQPEAPPDLIFSNAVFHWVPDHLPLLVRLAGYLAPGGQLAIQMPDNLGEPTHRLMTEVALDGPWSAAFADGLPERAALPAPRAYADALAAAGLEATIWRTAYFHRLPDAQAIVDFVRGAGLRPYADTIRRILGDAAERDFLAAYRDAIAAAYPPIADGSVLMAMPRLFVVAERA